MVKLFVDFQGEKFGLDLRRYTEDIEDMQPVFNDIAEEVYNIEERTFNAEGKPHWQALSPRYSLWKSRRYPNAKILELSGSLKGAATGRPKDLSKVEPIRLQTKKSLTMGVRGAYVVVHQNGGVNMPQRKYYNFSIKDLAGIARIYNRHAKRATERIFGI